MTRAALFVAAVIAALIGLIGCAAPSTSPGTTIGPALTAPADAVSIAAPAAVRIPAVGVASPPLVRLGLDDAGALTVPPLDQPDIAGWYGVRPGETGPSIVAAHVTGRIDGDPVPGLFFRLNDLAMDDTILIDHVDGTTTTWRVTGERSVPKNQFPTREVYGDEDRPVLHLITCDGELDPVTRSYRENLLIFAELA